MYFSFNFEHKHRANPQYCVNFKWVGPMYNRDDFFSGIIKLVILTLYYSQARNFLYELIMLRIS